MADYKKQIAAYQKKVSKNKKNADSARREYEVLTHLYEIDPSNTKAFKDAEKAKKRQQDYLKQIMALEKSIASMRMKQAKESKGK